MTYVFPDISNNFLTLTNDSICSGDNPGAITGSIPMGGRGSGHYNYVWQSSPDFYGPWVNLISGPDPTYNPGSLEESTCYRRIVVSEPPLLSYCNADTSAVVCITVNPKPIVDAGTVQFINENTTATLNGSVVGGIPPYSFWWEPASLVCSGQGTLYPTTCPLSGTTIFTLYATDSLDCTASDMVIINVNPGSGLICTSIWASPNQMCLGSSSQLGVTASGGTGTYSFSWEPPLYLSDPSINNPVASPPQTTEYTVTIDDGISTASCSVTVLVDPIPQIISPLVDTICSGEQVNYSPQSTVSNSTYKWTLINNNPCIIESIVSTDGIIILDYLVDTCSTIEEVYYQITPIGPGPDSCQGPTVNLIVRINPVSHITNNMNSQEVISGNPTNPVVFTSDVQDVTFEWTAIDNPNLSGYLLSGTGDLPSMWITIESTGTDPEVLVYEVIPYLNGCPGQPFLYTINVNLTPMQFVIMGGGSFCQNGTDCLDMSVWLTGSEPGVTYSLYRNGLPVFQLDQAGTGGVLVWDSICEGGTYTIKATNDINGSFIFMLGSALITVNPLPVVFQMMPHGDTCLPIIPGLNGSQGGIKYDLYRDGSKIWPPLTVFGTGNPEFLVFPEQTIEGTYSILATDTVTGCQQPMNDSIITYPLPIQYTIRPNGILCEGELVWLEHSQPGVMYQLWFDDSSYGNIEAGKSDGDSISFGYIQDPGTYTIHAWDTEWGCEILFDSNIVLNENPLIYSMTPPDGCPGSEIILNGCQEGVYYYLLFEPEVADNIVLVDSMECQGAAFLTFGPQYNAGTYYIKAMNQSSQCVSYMQNTTVIHPAPQQFNVTPSGGGCPPQEITLDGCEPDVVYYLYLNGIQIASDSCTDGIVNFGFQSGVGIYTVKGKRTYSSSLECWNDMNEQFEVYSLPLVFSLSPTGAFCPPQEIVLTGSESGVNYYLNNNNLGYVDTIIGSGGLISFGQQTAEGTYHIEAENDSSCIQVMDNIITLLPKPIVYNLEPSGNLCTETELWLSNSQIGFSYQLYLNGSTLIGAPIAGDGYSVSFGSQSQMGFYTVQAATNTLPGCSAIMEDTAFMTPLTDYSLTPPGMHCQGEEIFLNGSETGIQYELYHNNSSTSIIVAGTGNAISFGQQYAPGIYKIFASEPTLSCNAIMFDSCIIVPSPTVYSVLPPVGNCPPVEITLSGCEPGVMYYLFKDGEQVASDDCADGEVNFGQQTNAGVFTVKAKRVYAEGLTCWSDMADTVIVYPDPIVYALNPPDSICPPADFILSGSQAAVNYELFYNGTSVYSQAGTGNPLSMGNDYNNQGSYYVLATSNNYSCTDTMQGVSTILSSPEIYNIYPDDTVCSEVEIWQSNSEPGVICQLVLDGSNVVNTVPGNGGSVTLGIQSQPGIYTIIANTESTPSCSAIMNGATVIEPLVHYSIIPQGMSCPPAEIKLNGSQPGIEYTLWRNGGSVSPPNIISGTGQIISFGNYSLSGAYTIHAKTPDYSCDAIMLETCIIQEAPTAFNINPTGVNCLDDSISISLPETDNGIKYLLYRDGAYQQFVMGSGNGIDFGIQTLPGSYTIKAFDTTSGCQKWMNGSVDIELPPIAYTIIPQGLHCTDTIIGLNGSEIDVIYYLILNGTDTAGSVYGTGLSVNFGLISGQGIYTIMAVDTTTTCDTEITGELTLTSEPAVFNLSAVSDGVFCENTLGDTLRLNNSQTGAVYQLYKMDAPPVAIDALQAGANNTPLFWYNIPEGSYYVVASFPNAPYCTATMNNVATISVQPLPTVYAGVDTTICESSEFYIIDAFIENYSSIQWTIVNGTGSFNNSTIPNPVFAPGDVSIPTDMKLIVSVHGLAPCNSEIVSDTLVVTVESLPEVYAGADAIICENDQYEIADALISYESGIIWSINSGNGSLNDTGLEHPIYTPGIGDAGTTAELIVHAFGIGSCINNTISDTLLIQVQPLPEVFAGADTIICENDQYEIADALISYESGIIWSINSGNGSLNDTGLEHPIYTPGIGDAGTTVELIVHAFGVGSCLNDTISDTLEIQVQPLPEVYAGADTIICENAPYEIADALISYESGIIWSINSGNGSLNNAGLEHPTYTPGIGDAGTTVELIVNALGFGSCINDTISDTLFIQIQKLPEVYAGADAIICVNEPYLIGDATVNYLDSVLWTSTGNGSFIDPKIINAIYSPAESDAGQVIYLTLSSYGLLGCANQFISDGLSLFVNQSPNPDFSYSDGSPILGFVQFTDLSSGGWSNITSWQWDFGDGAYSTLQHPSHIYQYVDSCYNVQLIVTNENNCSDTISQDVCVASELMVDFIYNDTCFGNPITFTGDTIQPANAIINTWVWNFGDGSLEESGNPVTHIFDYPGSFLVTLVAYDNYGNPSPQAYHMVEVFPLPEPDFSWNPLPLDLSVEFSGNVPPNSAPVTNWLWDFNGDGSIDSYQQNDVWIYDEPGTYNAALTVIDTHGCSSEITKTVERLPLISASFEVIPQPLCSNHSISFADISMNSDQIELWEWDFGDALPEVYDNFRDTISHTYSSPGSYSVCLIVKMTVGLDVLSDTSCQVVIIQPSPHADFSWIGICEGDTTQFADESTDNGIPIVSWNWDFGDGNGTMEQNPIYHFNDTFSHNIGLIVENSIGCSDTIENELRLYSLPEVYISNNIPCITRLTLFTDSSTADQAEINSWSWLINDNGTHVSDSNKSVEYIFNSPGSYPVNLSVGDTNGCVNSGEFLIDVFSIPISEFSVIYNYNNIQGQVKFENHSKDAVDYLWDFDYFGGPSSTDENPVWTYSYDGQYVIELIASTSDYCSDTSYQTCHLVYIGLFIPNAFSPEDPDPAVNNFLPRGVGLEYFNIEVFDVWGTMVWNSKAITLDGQPEGPGWDGTYKGKPLPSGMYVWKAHAEFIDGTIWKGSDFSNGKKPETQGSLMLIR